MLLLLLRRRERKKKKKRFFVTVVGDATPGVLVGACPGIALYTHVVHEVGGCLLLPSLELQEKCLNREPWDSRDLAQAAAYELGPTALYLEVGAKHDVDLRRQLADVGVASLEVEDAASCANFSYTFDSADDYYATASKYYAATSAAIPNSLAYLTNVTHHRHIDFASTLTTLEDDLALVENPFADDASALTHVAKSLDYLIPSIAFDVNAAGLESDGASYDPALMDWLTTAVLHRRGASHCDGLAVDGTPPNIDTCDTAITNKTYDRAIPCDSDADCPRDSVCRSLSFPHGGLRHDDDEDLFEDNSFCVASGG